MAPSSQEFPPIAHSSLGAACKGMLRAEHGTRYYSVICDGCNLVLAVLEPDFFRWLIKLLDPE